VSADAWSWRDRERVTGVDRIGLGARAVMRADPVPGSASGPARAPLRETPLIVIEPRPAWASIDLAGLWASRELFFFLMWRDLKVRYRQTVLGAGWAVLQPLLTMVIFTYFFGRLVNVSSDGLSYPVFAYTGLLTWTFFANAVALSSNSLVANTALITKVYFPRVIIPAAAVCATLVDVAIACVLLVPLMLFYGVPLTWTVGWVPLFIILAAALALAVGLVISAVTVRYRDARYVFPFLLQTWFFVSPIIYPSSLVPAEHRWLLWLNPLTGIVESSRAVVFGRSIELAPLLVSILLPPALLLVASVMFRRAEKAFAEFI
jgi:lipopolysaccharide transport system permease protein